MFQRYQTPRIVLKSLPMLNEMLKMSWNYLITRNVCGHVFSAPQINAITN